MKVRIAIELRPISLYTTTKNGQVVEMASSAMKSLPYPCPPSHFLFPCRIAAFPPAPTFLFFSCHILSLLLPPSHCK